ncbi:MAG: PQQ-like beta-propeller repeat protein [Planctomycetes bacterium]|nr:PQQ-like beta-propeller repeat protein [Planctomycetota bacterium]
MTTCLVHASIVLATLVSGASAAHGDDGDDGAVAEAGSWNTRGGPVARTGVSASRPLWDTPHELWARDVGASIVGEPLLERGCVVLETLAGSRQRSLELFDLRDGAQLWSSHAFDGATPLEPSLSGDLIAVRSSTRTIDLLRVRGTSVELASRIERKGAVASPLLFGDELYVRTELGIECLDARTGAQHWNLSGTFRGALSLRGDELYAVRYNADLRGQLLRLNRANGEQGEELTALWHDGKVPPFDAEGSIDVLLPQVLFHSSLPIPVANKPPSFGTILDLSQPSEVLMVLSLVAPCTDHGAGWYSVVEDEAGVQLIDDSRAANGTFDFLANREHQAAVVRTPMAVSIAGPVGYVGGIAFELASRRVLWRHATPVTRRMVPTDGGVLVVENESRLVHLGSTPADPPSEWLASEALAPANKTLAKATVYLLDGSSERRDVVLDREARVIRDAARRKSAERRFADVCALEDSDKRLLFASDARGWIRAIDRATDAELATKCLALAREALTARDAVMARKLHDDACLYGCENGDSAKLLKALDQFAQGKPQPPAQGKANAVFAARRELDGAHAAALAVRLEKLAPEAPKNVRIELAREILARVPEAESARRVLRAEVAAGLEHCADAELDGAIELTRVLERFEGKVVEPPTTTAAPGAEASPTERALAQLPAAERAELLVLRTPRLLLICSPRAPRSIARVIAFGELACKALEPLFGDALRTGPPLEPLVVCVHATVERYDQDTAKTASEEPRNRERAFAHFDPTTMTTHVGFPDDEPTLVPARERFVHAIAHHWLRERCPRFSQRLSRRANRKEPGYWIAEGLAGFVEELEYDVAAGTARLPEQATDSLALNATLPSSSLHHWPALLVWSRDAVDAQSALGSGVVARRGWLDLAHPTSPLDVYEAQATALVHYLYEADDGKRRAKLADFAHAYFVGNADGQVGAPTTFGTTAEALGEAVYEWASARARAGD